MTHGLDITVSKKDRSIFIYATHEHAALVDDYVKDNFEGSVYYTHIPQIVSPRMIAGRYVLESDQDVEAFAQRFLKFL